MAWIVKGFYIRLIVMVFLWLMDAIFGSDTSFDDGLENVPITYWAAMGYLAYFCLYLMRLRCSFCGEPVIYKTVNFSGWRLPKSHCSNCGEEL